MTYEPIMDLARDMARVEADGGDPWTDPTIRERIERLSSPQADALRWVVQDQRRRIEERRRT